MHGNACASDQSRHALTCLDRPRFLMEKGRQQAARQHQHAGETLCLPLPLLSPLIQQDTGAASTLQSMLVVDGSFEDQIDELATFIDSLSQEESKVQEAVEQALQQDDKEAAIRSVVQSSGALGHSSEKGWQLVTR